VGSGKNLPLTSQSERRTTGMPRRIRESGDLQKRGHESESRLQAIPSFANSVIKKSAAAELLE
jgi:hypothetical protein